MDNADMKDYATILDQMLDSVSNTSDMRAKSQLFKMYRNCKKVYVDLDRETVECRRLNKVTIKYMEIAAELEESIRVFDQWMTFSKLLY